MNRFANEWLQQVLPGFEGILRGFRVNLSRGVDAVCQLSLGYVGDLSWITLGFIYRSLILRRGV